MLTEIMAEPGARAPQVEHRVVSLPTGQLEIRVDRSDLPLDDICGFAARRNPKRGFLFVSRVLGKHIPVKPSVMRDVHTRLARRIPSDLPSPVVLVGMAETAIGLGHGVYEQYLRMTGRHDVLFIHSTRYRLQQPAALEFLEEHSHAADHIIYKPVDLRDRALFHAARSLVLIDDEASTGKTFVNLTRAFQSTIPSLEFVVTGVITDWRGAERKEGTAKAMPVASHSVAVLEGEYRFTAAANLTAVDMPRVAGNGQSKDAILSHNYGRLGLRGVLQPNLAKVEQLALRHHQRCLILGTGEFAYPPFLLAEELENRGFDVRYQSTTRSPIMLGGAIGTALSFADNYRDGIPNFIYNADRKDYDRIVVCHETPSDTLDGTVLQALGAENLEF